MIYSVQKRGGVWTVTTHQVLLSFENYGDAVAAAQSAADVLRHSRTSLNPCPFVGDNDTIIQSNPSVSR
jgi:hypothetical protein